MSDEQPKLNARQRRFVQEYLVDLNATQAALRAGYSSKTAGQIGHELLKKPEIGTAISTAQQERATLTGITATRVLGELELLSFSDLMHYTVDDKGDVAPAEGAPAGVMRALQSIKRKVTVRGSGDDQQVTREVEIRLWDKPGPLKLAGQHVGLFTDKLKVEHENPPVLYLPANERDDAGDR